MENLNSTLINGVKDIVADENFTTFLKTQGVIQSKKIIGNILSTHKQKSEISDSYIKYRDKLIDSYSTSKTLLYKQTHFPFYTYYVDLELNYYLKTPIKETNHTIKTDRYQNLFEFDKNIVIKGTAGSGKTTLLKHIFLSSCIDTHILPFFFELKQVNQESSSTPNLLINSLLSDMKNKSLNLTIDDFYKFIENENVIIFLDGYDEIYHELRLKINKEINFLASKKCHIIITTRPNNYDFLNFNKFTELSVKPLNTEQSRELVTKLCSNDTTSEFEIERFLEDINKHHLLNDSFMLTNPLMLTILMIAYIDVSSIPNKSYILYDRAFNALYSNHDSFKDLFSRKKYSGLDDSQFKTIFRTLSMFCYFNNKEEFNDISEINSYLNKVQKLTSIKFKNDSIINDFVESLCIIVKEGQTYEYIHRSFLEYFAADFFINESLLNNDAKIEILKKLDLTTENRVFDFMLEMDVFKLIQLVLKPLLTDILSIYDCDLNRLPDAKKFINDNIRSLSIQRYNGKNEDFLEFLNKNNYSEEFITPQFGASIHLSKEIRILQNIYDKFVTHKKIDTKLYQTSEKTFAQIFKKFNNKSSEAIINYSNDGITESISFNTDYILSNPTVYGDFKCFLGEFYAYLESIVLEIKYYDNKVAKNQESIFNIINIS